MFEWCYTLTTAYVAVTQAHFVAILIKKFVCELKLAFL